MLVGAVLVACSATSTGDEATVAAPGSTARPGGSRSTPTSTSTSSTTTTAAPVTTTSIVAQVEVGTVAATQLAPYSGPCSLVPGATDFSDLPAEASRPTVTPEAGGNATFTDPFPDEPGIPIGLWPPGFEAAGAWFQLGPFGAAHLNAEAVAADAVVLVEGDCRVEGVAGSDDAVALFVCPEPVLTPRVGCAVLVAEPSGTEVGRWAVDLDDIGTIDWADGELVLDLAVIGSFTYGWRTSVVDPTTGAGVTLQSVGRCGSGDSRRVVTGTAFVSAQCTSPDGSTEHLLIDARTGSVANRRATSVWYVAPATQVIGLRQPTYDVATLAEVAPILPVATDAALAIPEVELQYAFATPVGVWAMRSDGANGVDLELFDASGAVVGRWDMPLVPTMRGVLSPTSGLHPAFDATGAWVAVDGRLVRLDPRP